MKAVVQDRYGPPQVLRLEERPVPVPGGGEVLLRVRATSVNLSDWETLRGRPAYARLGGLRRPARPVLGSDVAGVVEALGPDVTGLEVGDEVVGDLLASKGGFAEYCLAPASALAAKPPELSFVQAAAVPQSAAIALQGTRWAGPGVRVCVNGAGGGSGAFCIQLAVAAGAHVTAVDTGAKLDHMRSLGAHEVLDHTRDDFTRHGPFDLVLDLVARRSVFAYRRALAPDGRYRCVGGSTRALLRVLTVGSLLGVAGGRSLGVLAVREGPEHFGPLLRRCAEGAVEVRVDRTYSLDEVPAALERVGSGRSLGKVVVEVG